MEKINVAELLKDCPKGTKLYSPLFGDVLFEKVINNMIYINTEKEYIFSFDKYGRYKEYTNSECLLFPSKENRDWSTFQRPFKDGDVVSVTMIPEGIWIGIFKQHEETSFESYCYLNTCGEFCSTGSKKHSLKGIHLATEEEKEKLFDAIKANGYKWSPETKTLEKLLKFKVGDRVKKNKDYISGIVTDIFDDSFKVTYDGGGCSYVQFHYQCDWELIPNKFDIATLKPFDSKVLVREDKTDVWRPTFYGFFNQQDKRFYTTSCGTWLMCIPYNEDTKHLTGTINDCDEFYKTWE